MTVASVLSSVDATHGATHGATQIEIEIERLAQSTAEPEAVLSKIRRFEEQHGDVPDHLATFTRALTEPRWRKRLVAVLGNSPYLTHLIIRWPDFLAAIMDGREENPEQTILQAHSWEEAARVLRHDRHRNALRIGMLDLTGEYTLEKTVSELSDTADRSLKAAFRWLTRDLSKRHGVPMLIQEEGAPKPARFVVLGMGKLGGHELNFSSDIDLIFLYDGDEGETTGPRRLSLKAYFTRLGQGLMKLMQEMTDDGMAFRTDLRLRPDGESGDLCLSCRSAEIYYESWGQTWERAAMIKARPVAGDLALGELFLKTVRPFVYRRYLDFGALENIRAMKRKIDRKTMGSEDYHRNVKLGYGGIREIEFFVQSHQLIYGGQQPALRVRGTLAVLEALQAQGLIDGMTAGFLASAYRFLRTVEHRLQIVQDQQIHTLPLPEQQDARVQLARRMGFSGADEFHARLSEITDGVHQRYDALFFSAERVRSERLDPFVEALLECDLRDDAICMASLKAAGFSNPLQAKSLLHVLREGPPTVALTETARRWYDRLAPLLIQEILKASDQDLALRHTEQFLAHIGLRSNYLALLVENPSVVQLLISVFGVSAYFSHTLNAHPDLLDHLLTHDFLDGYRDRSLLEQDLLQEMSRYSEPGHRREALRVFKNRETLRMGIRDISGLVELPEVMAGLSALADVILRAVLRETFQEMVDRYGAPGWVDLSGERRELPFAIVAMGKLGGAELNYASDLDLLFIYDDVAAGKGGGEAWTDGARSISGSQFFAQLGRKIISALTTLTCSGKLYEIDMRLRPSGRSGPLVTSFTAFENYQRNDAWTWEHQALTRARVVAGERGFAQKIHREIRKILAVPRARNTLREEIQTMRERMFQEKKPPEGVLDLKQTRGGIVDVEFLTQYLMLQNAATHPDCLQRNIHNALHIFQKLKILTSEEYAILEQAYTFYRLVENRLRLLSNRSENRVPGSDRPRKQRRLERLCYGSAEREEREEREITAVLQDHCDAVIAIVRKFWMPS